MMEISTSRLFLRSLLPTDAANLVELNSDPAVQEFLGEAPPTLDALSRWINRVNANSPRGGDRGFWAAE